MATRVKTETRPASRWEHPLLLAPLAVYAVSFVLFLVVHLRYGYLPEASSGLKHFALLLNGSSFDEFWYRLYTPIWLVLHLATVS
jgi:hypothetical protein